MRSGQESACRVISNTEGTPSKAEILLKEFSILMQQVGVHGLALEYETPPASHGQLIADPVILNKMLSRYVEEMLAPVELPAVTQASELVRRGELRELICLDQRLACEGRFGRFANASRQIGTLHLQRLRPLRDERIVRRYLTAVESGHAAAWHPLVFGLTLAIYAFPLRQGLLHYSNATVVELCRAATGPVRFLETPIQNMLQSLLAELPKSIEQNIPRWEIAI